MSDLARVTISAVRGTHQPNTLVQLYDVAERAEVVALMADGHLGYIMPVGGVAAYRNKVSVAGVGFDIGCGNTALKTDLQWNLIAPDRDLIADQIQASLSFGVGRKNHADSAPIDHELFGDLRWLSIPVKHREALRAKAREQLGTIGSGNHYVDIFEDRDGLVWVGVHFGSRGLGHTIAKGFMNLAQNKPWDAPGGEVEALLDLDTPLGDSYWHARSLASKYADIGREWVVRHVASMLGARIEDVVSNHHNDAWEETHFGEKLIVVRKGATPAWPGQRGFIGGSMGDDAVIVRGAEASEAARNNLFSTVHGAGRVMSRTEAKGKKGRPGKVTPDDMERWLLNVDVTLRGGGLDEAPQAYRRLDEVLKDQGDTIIVEEVLTPRIVVMAGANEFDPYKD